MAVNSAFHERLASQHFSCRASIVIQFSGRCALANKFAIRSDFAARCVGEILVCECFPPTEFPLHMNAEFMCPRKLVEELAGVQQKYVNVCAHTLMTKDVLAYMSLYHLIWNLSEARWVQICYHGALRGKL